ncbi:MAG TPA: hypothetical protein VE998_08945 [Terriglobales bacterium]|nr:hypothetical protein [Terriglobales bacterium]
MVLHLCRGTQVESTFGTQTRLFSSDGHDTPARDDEVETLLAVLGQNRSLFARVPLSQAHAVVSCK